MPKPSSEPIRVLVVDDEDHSAKSLATFLKFRGFEVVTAPGGRRALEVLRGSDQDVVITDLKMPDLDGLALTKKVRESRPDTEVVLVTAYGTIKTAVEAIRAGAYDYLTKPIDQDELLLVLGRIREKVDLLRELTKLRRRWDERAHFGLLVGESPEMQELYEGIERAARTQATVLITGETGTGKELIARAIHQHGTRRNGPFVAVNCAALPEHLVESELFGHVKGAFTGATNDRQGKFEAADGGTLLLDEVTNMNAYVQAKLLRVLQEKRFEAVGSDRPRSVDVRILAISNEDVLAAVKAGKFREDLFYRLNVLHLMAPPLRRRKRDLPLLIEHFTEKHAPPAAAEGVPRRYELSPQVMEVFFNHSWPGNIRELENVVERMLAVADGEHLTVAQLPASFRDIALFSYDGSEGEQTYKTRIEAFEKYLLSRKLAETQGNVMRAARELKMPLRTMRRKINRYRLYREKLMARSNKPPNPA